MLSANRATVERVCEECGKPFQAPLYNVKRGRGRFCSPACVVPFAHRRLSAKYPNGTARTKPGALTNTEHVRRFRQRHPEIAECWRVYSAARRAGRIWPAHECQRCGARVPLQGHHDDYSKPLEVRWLCCRCHRIVDKHRRSIESRRNRGLEALSRLLQLSQEVLDIGGGPFEFVGPCNDSHRFWVGRAPVAHRLDRYRRTHRSLKSHRSSSSGTTVTRQRQAARHSSLTTQAS